MRKGIVYIYDCARADNEYGYLFASVSTHLPYVDDIFILDSSITPHPHTQQLLDLSSKISYEHTLRYGNDFNNDFDQISARNYTLTKAMESGWDYIIPCDADEFYSPQYFDNCDQSRMAPEIFWLSKTKYVKWFAHLRGVRSIDNPRYVSGEPTLIKYVKNKTSHCTLVVDTTPVLLDTLYRNHLKYIKLGMSVEEAVLHLERPRKRIPWLPEVVVSDLSVGLDTLHCGEWPTAYIQLV